MPTADVERLVEMAETELLGLHEGNFARFRLREPEYERWRARWDEAKGRTSA